MACVRDSSGKPGAPEAGGGEDLQRIARPRAAGARPKTDQKNVLTGFFARKRLDFPAYTT